ncbi:MAG: SH3 domain-containing protein [Caldilinea sp.]|nr:SH3 domain-containing protein [Caldilinea sp.]MDW8442826.1 SH3 domain-containing protein [Caldilineaceae bacterium]
MNRTFTPQRSPVQRTATALLLAGGLLATLLLFTTALAQDGRTLVPGAPASGQVISAAGEEWTLYACAGDQVTITIFSTAFAPYLSVYTDVLQAPLFEALAEEGERAQALMTVEASGFYTVAAAGERRSDRGPYTLTVDFGDLPETLLDEAAGVLVPSSVVTGAVRTGLGDLWALRGCAGDVIRVAVQSERFTPYAELVDPQSGEAISVSVPFDDETAMIENAVLSTTGVYELIVAGARRSDRGPYTLTVHLSDTIPSAFLISPVAATTRTPTASPTPQPLCTVRATPNLNLRSGPGTVFPVIGVLPVNTQLRPLGRNADASWVEVQPLPAGRTGWVAAAPRFIECTFALATLQLVASPPTPPPSATATPTPRPTATPTAPPPTLPPVVVLPGPAPDDASWRGALVTNFNLVNLSDGVAVFRDRIFFRAEIERTPNNQRIERVDFRILDALDEEIYRRTERVYGYCAFGGGEPTCNVLEIRRGARWPDTERALCNGDFTVVATIVLDNGDTATWRSPFRIEHPDLPLCGQETQRSELVVRIVQTGPEHVGDVVYGALVFQVEAYDPTRGGEDGAGVRSVDLRIFDPDGREVYQRTERNAAYCAFAGGEPDCNVWRFREHGDAWPSGEPVRYGEPHLLRAIANAEDGRSASIEMTVVIQP